LKSKAENLRNLDRRLSSLRSMAVQRAILGIADPVKPEAAQAIRDLRSQGLRV